MIGLNVKCVFCGHSLMDKKTMIDSRPSIRVVIANGRKKGNMQISSLCGSQNFEMEFKVSKDKISRFHCPHCGRELNSEKRCAKCKAPLIFFALEDGGLVQMCSRGGCSKSFPAFESPEVGLRAFYDTYSVFFK